MAVHAFEELTPLQRSYLGVLSLGLVSAEQARDGRFRMEFVTANAHALLHGLEDENLGAAEVDGDHHASEEFRQGLRGAIIDLDRKGIIGIGTPQEVLILRPAAPDPDSAYGEVDVNRHPPIFDRYLAQRCMEELLANSAAHAYLMALYADSGDVWGRLYKEGAGNWR